MMNSVRLCSALAVGALLLACSGGDEPLDSGVPADAGVEVDSGLRALCPVPGNNPTCNAAVDCAEPSSAPQNCEWCIARNESVCVLGQCATPEPIDAAQAVQATFRAPDLETVLESYAGYVVTKETSGGNALSCSDILANSISWDEACYNVVDVRHFVNGGGTGDTFPMLFSSLPGGLEVLVIAYAFADEEATEAPIGVACAEASVPLKGATTEPTPVSAGEMTDLR